MSDVTQILNAIEAGDQQAAEKLFPLVYGELRKLAAQKLSQEKPGQSLQATALVHEAYLRLVGDQQFDSSSHFFAAAAEAMRRILVDSARRRHSQKHGGLHAASTCLTWPIALRMDRLICWLWMRPCNVWKPNIPTRLMSSNFAFLQAAVSKIRHSSWASHARLPSGTGFSHGPGCSDSLIPHDPIGSQIISENHEHAVVSFSH